MAQPTKANITTARNTAKDAINGQMDARTKANCLKIISTALGSSCGRMEGRIKDR
jgi:hypothetical protein